MPSGSTSEQYNQAFGLLKQADYPAAEVALKAFVEQHPNDPMAGNAQYWLGETYYTRGRYADAASAFAEGYKRYPRRRSGRDWRKRCRRQIRMEWYRDDFSRRSVPRVGARFRTGARLR